MLYGVGKRQSPLQLFSLAPEGGGGGGRCGGHVDVFFRLFFSPVFRLFFVDISRFHGEREQAVLFTFFIYTHTHRSLECGLLN